MRFKSYCFQFLIPAILLTGILLSCSGEKRRTKAGANIVVQDSVVNHPKPIVKVYIENSGSMYGYVTGQTEFEQIVYNFLVDLKLSEVTDSLNLFYINSTILPQKEDIEDFIKKLEPNTFKAKGGNHGASDIANMIKDIVNGMDENSISLFVSDCIFSPGNNKDAEDYLNNQQIGIKNSIGTYYNSHTQTAIIGYRYTSSFKGTYYDKNDKPQHYDGKRPFYIWIFGSQNSLKQMLNKMSDSGYGIKDAENEYVAFGAGAELSEEQYAIKIGSGKFEIDKKNPKHALIKLKKSHNGNAQFAIDVDFAHLLLGDDYLCDTSMYRLNDSSITLESVRRSNNSKYTHTLYFSTTQPHPTNLEVKLLAKIPTWPHLYNDPTGLSLGEGNKDKTFGILQMINGLTEAVVRKDHYTKFGININN